MNYNDISGIFLSGCSGTRYFSLSDCLSNRTHPWWSLSSLANPSFMNVHRSLLCDDRYLFAWNVWHDAHAWTLAFMCPGALWSDAHAL